MKNKDGDDDEEKVGLHTGEKIHSHAAFNILVRKQSNHSTDRRCSTSKKNMIQIPNSKSRYWTIMLSSSRKMTITRRTAG